MTTEEIDGFLPKDLCRIVDEYTKAITCDVCKYTYDWGFQCKFLASGAHTLTHTHCAGCFRTDGGHTWNCSKHPYGCEVCKRHDGGHMWNCSKNLNFCYDCKRHDDKHTWDCTAHQRH